MERDSAHKLLKAASLEQAVGGAIEEAIVGGNLRTAEKLAIKRFLKSPDLSNRVAAMWALVHFCDETDIVPEAIEILVSGVVVDDSDVYLAAIGALGIMAGCGNANAERVLAALRANDTLRKLLQIA